MPVAVPPKTPGRQPNRCLPAAGLAALIFLYAVGNAFAAGEAQKPVADLIFQEGEILTMDENHPSVEAVAVLGGRILAAGRRSAVMACKGAGTRLVSLGGKTLLPRFIAVHTRPELSAYLLSLVDMSGFSNKTPEEVWGRLNAAVSSAEPGAWIFCKGFDPMLVPGLHAPTRKQLDEMAPENPVAIIAQSLHSAWANTLAFEKLGITARTPDPGPASDYEKNARGELSGFIAETAAIEPFTQAALETMDMSENIAATLNRYAKNGYTTVTSAGVFAKDSKLLMLYQISLRRNRGCSAAF